MSAGIVGYASYLPRYRLEGKDIGSRNDRVVAAFDEDATTMAVAAASQLLPAAASPPALYFATSSPPYADKTNATAIHAALGLPPNMLAADMCGTGRSAFAAMAAAAQCGGVAVAADVRIGRPGSADEKTGGDGAAALLFGEDNVVADVLASCSVTEEFLDRWREPITATGQQWEERFGGQRYTSLIHRASSAALDAAGIADPDHVVLACPNSAVLKRAATMVKGQKSVTTSPAGFGGAADVAIALCGALDIADAHDTILLLSATDGCDAMVLRTTELLTASRQARTLEHQRAQGLPIKHLTYLSWRGLVALEPPRRPEPERPAAPPASRAGHWKFGFTGSRCQNCGFVHLPPTRMCRACGTADAMDPTPAAGLRGTVVTYTVDRLAFSPSPPMLQAVIDVDGGGRCTLEVADARPDELNVGARVRFSFRRLFTADGVHNYFWKAVLDDAE